MNRTFHQRTPRAQISYLSSFTGRAPLRAWLHLGVWLLLVIFSASLWAASEPGKESKPAGIDAVLIMDSSGSMLKNDPKKLRVPAAKLFMSLLGEEDRVGLISFSDAGYPVLHLSHLKGEMQEKALTYADRVSSKGIYTNLHAALLKGREMLRRQGDPKREQMLILMSDGRMDVGDDFENHQLTQQVRGEVLQQLQDENIKVYSIAFTEASDTELLRALSENTGALYRLAKSDRDLHDVFSTIFESAKSPDMLPMEGGEFIVDNSIEEVTIVASKERSDVQIFLETPSGKRISAADAGDKLKWFMSDNFDMITVREPEQGRWKLLFSAGNNRAYIVTNLSMNTNLKSGDVPAGEETAIESWLEKDGKILTAEAVLTNTQFFIEITEPDGAVSDPFPLLDMGEYGDRVVADSIYSNVLTFRKKGEHSLKVTARGETFERSKTAFFNVLVPEAPVAPPVAEPVPEPVPEPAPEPEPKPEPEPVPEPPPEPPPVMEEVIEEPAEPAQEEGSNLGMILGVFFGVNLLLGLIGGGVWWFLSRRKKKALEATADDAGDELE